MSEIEHFEIFNRLRENKLAKQFFIKFNVIVLSHFLMLGVFYAYTEEYKHNDCFLKTKPTFTTCKLNFRKLQCL